MLAGGILPNRAPQAGKDEEGRQDHHRKVKEEDAIKRQAPFHTDMQVKHGMQARPQGGGAAE